MFLGELPMTLRPEMVEYSEDENTLLQKRKKKNIKPTTYDFLAASSVPTHELWATFNCKSVLNQVPG